MFVCISFLIGFGHCECIFGSLNTIGYWFQEVSNRWNLVWNVCEGRVWIPWVLAMIQVEWCHASGLVWCIIASKFCSSELGIPVILSVAGEGSQHIFKGSICSFSLAIHLRVECGGHCEFCTQGLEESLPEFACELGILVRDNGFWKTMKSENVIEKYVGCVWCWCCGLGGGEVDHFREHIDKNYNCIIPSLSFWQLDNEIHGNPFPRLLRGHKWL